MDTITEILSDASKDLKTLLPLKSNRYLMNFMETAFLKSKKLNFPEGNPPYIPTTANEQQLKGSFWQFARKIDTLRRTDVHALRLETILVQSLESVSETEAKIIVHMKDQTLSEMYPEITLESLKSVGYFTNEQV